MTRRSKGVWRLRRARTQPETPAPTFPRQTPPLAGEKLPPYSAATGVCAKCGTDVPYTEYYDARRTCVHRNGPGPRVRWGQERMHRTCRRCGFEWDEDVATRGKETTG
jgi:hypothetical protein